MKDWSELTNEDKLTAYLMGDLPEEQRQDVEQLIENDEDCRALAGELEHTLQLLEEGLSEPVLKQETLTELEQERIRQEMKFSLKRWFIVNQRPVVDLAAALMIFMVGAALFFPLLEASKNRRNAGREQNTLNITFMEIDEIKLEEAGEDSSTLVVNDPVSATPRAPEVATPSVDELYSTTASRKAKSAEGLPPMDVSLADMPGKPLRKIAQHDAAAAAPVSASPMPLELKRHAEKLRRDSAASVPASAPAPASPALKSALDYDAKDVRLSVVNAPDSYRLGYRQNAEAKSEKQDSGTVGLEDRLRKGRAVRAEKNELAGPPLSTASANVDTSPYREARRYILSGQRPPSESIRADAFINYFDYAYPAADAAPLHLHAEAHASPWGPGYLLTVAFKGRSVQKGQAGDDAAGKPVAHDVSLQVEFDSKAVRRYRRMGSPRRQSTTPLAGEQLDAGTVMAGQASTALYQLDMRTDHPEAFGTVRLRYRDPGNGEFVTVRTPLMKSGLQAQPSADFKVAVGAAQFAELLQGRAQAETASYDEALKYLWPVTRELTLDVKLRELVSLIQHVKTLPPPQ